MDKLARRQKLILPQDFINYVEKNFLEGLKHDLQPHFPREQKRDIYLVHKDDGHKVSIELNLRWNPYGTVLRPTGISWGVTYPLEVDQRPGSDPTGYIHLRPVKNLNLLTLKIETTNFQSLNIVSGEEVAKRYHFQNCWTIDAVVDRLGEYAHQEFKLGRKRS